MGIIIKFDQFDPVKSGNKRASVTEGGRDEQNYMFFSNAENICRMAKEILDMDRDELDAHLTEHDWAQDHMARAKETISHVYNWLKGGSDGNRDIADDKDGVTITGEVPVEESLTDKAQSYVSMKIAKLKSEGYPDDQAAAIAYSMARKKGYKVDKNESVSEDERRQQKLERPLDASYVQRAMQMQAQDLRQDDPEVAAEMRVLSRWLSGHHRDVELGNLLDQVDDQVDDQEVADKLKSELEELWLGI